MTQTSPNPAGYLDRLSRQYIDLVYAAALRRLRGDADRAADITQAVMLVMVRKAQAGKLPKEKYMAGWLIKVTGYAVLQADRSAARRTRHESAAAQMNAHETSDATDTGLNDDIRAALDDSLLRLGGIDREVLIRRHLQGQTLAQIGTAMGMEENTVGKRIVRAIPKLRTLLLRRGISAPAAAITTVLTAEFAIKAPAVAAMTSVASSIGPPISASITELAKRLSWKIAIMKLKLAALLGLALFLTAAAGTAVLISHARQALMRSAAAAPPFAQSTPMQPSTRFQIRLVAANNDPNTESLPSFDGSPATTLVSTQQELTTSDLESARLGQNTSDAAIEITFTNAGAAKFAELTKTHLNNNVAFIFDGKILCAPTIRSEIGRVVTISVGQRMTRTDAEMLAKSINQTISEQVLTTKPSATPQPATTAQ